MSIFISLVIFALGLALFFITNNKIKNIKDNILIEDTKKELESLLSEFNGAAARNIELLESKIGDLQDTINKANGKMADLDDKIGRANRPFVVEKYVERNTSVNVPAAPANHKETAASYAAAENVRPFRPEPDRKKALPVFDKKKGKARVEEPRKTGKAPVQETRKEHSKTVIKEKPRSAETKTAPAAAQNPEPLTRSEQLKKYIQEGLSKQDLIAKGFMENEINLLSFLIKKNV